MNPPKEYWPYLMYEPRYPNGPSPDRVIFIGSILAVVQIEPVEGTERRNGVIDNLKEPK